MELNKTSVCLWLISSTKVKGISFFKTKYNRKGSKQNKKNQIKFDMQKHIQCQLNDDNKHQISVIKAHLQAIQPWPWQHLNDE
jgi:hypothetical protein